MTTFRSRLVLPLCLALGSSAYALTPEERPYLGGYTSGSVDTVSQIMLVAGHWKALPGKDAGIRLQEVRKPAPQFPAFAKPRPGSEVVFDFHGYTLGEARSPVFAVSATAAWPVQLRPLFAEGRESWAESYPLPAMPTATARYFYIGQMEVDARGKSTQLRVIQYQLPAALQGGKVRLGFDTQQARPALDMLAVLKGERLQVDGQPFGKRDALTPVQVGEIRSACVAPVLNPGKGRAAEDADDQEDTPRERMPALVPRGSKLLPLSSVQGAPWVPVPNL